MEWYYTVNGEQKGPVSQDQFDELVRTGVICGDTLVWREGMAEWATYGQVFQQQAPGSAAPPTLAPSGSRRGPETNGLAIASLILAIASFACGSCFFSLPGVITGHMALAQINRSEYEMGGRGLAIAGLIISYTNLVIVVLLVLFFITGDFVAGS